MKKQIKVLELFAGSRTVGKVAAHLGMRVFSVDWKPLKGIDLVADIGTLKASDIPFVPDLIWASPDCTTYSVAAIAAHRNGTTPTSDYARKSDRVNRHMVALIRQWLELNPNLVFFIENPRGMLRKMPFMQKFTRHTVWYCQYGDARAKPTDIWTNSRTWTPQPPCYNGNKNCHHHAAPRGSRTGTQGQASHIERGSIPRMLVIEVLRCVQNPV